MFAVHVLASRSSQNRTKRPLGLLSLLGQRILRKLWQGFQSQPCRKQALLANTILKILWVIFGLVVLSISIASIAGSLETHWDKTISFSLLSWDCFLVFKSARLRVYTSFVGDRWLVIGVRWPVTVAGDRAGDRWPVTGDRGRWPVTGGITFLGNPRRKFGIGRSHYNVTSLLWATQG